MYSYGPTHMAVQKQDDQHEHTFSNYVRIRDVVQKTCLRRCTIGKSGERGSGISVLPARYDDDDIYIYMCVCVCVCVRACFPLFVNIYKIYLYINVYSFFLSTAKSKNSQIKKLNLPVYIYTFHIHTNTNTQHKERGRQSEREPLTHMLIAKQIDRYEQR